MKAFELLKELLLTESAGAHDSVYKAIDLAIQIYCEANELDEKDFKEKIKIIYQTVWENYWLDMNTDDWLYYQKKYEMFIDMLA